MNISPTLPVIMNNQARFIASPIADAVWEELCDNFLPGRPFTITQAIAKSERLSVYAPHTAYNYMRVVLAAVIADHAQRTEEYDGHIPLRTLGKHRPTQYVL